MLDQNTRGNFNDTEAGDFGPKGNPGQFEAPTAEMLDNSPHVYLYDTDNSVFININANGWAVTDEAKSTKYVIAEYGDVHYIVVANGTSKGYYLSYNRNSYVGAYAGWLDARYWSADPVDCLPYPGVYPKTNPSKKCSYVMIDGVRDAIDKIVTVVAW